MGIWRKIIPERRDHRYQSPWGGKEFGLFQEQLQPGGQAYLNTMSRVGKDHIFLGVLDSLTPMRNMKLVQEPLSKRIV